VSALDDTDGGAQLGRVLQVSVSRGGVPKWPIERAWVGRLGLEGDGHNEPEPLHGGPDQAVCIYTIESIARVLADGHDAFPGAYGENLTLQGIELRKLQDGDRLSIGEGGLLIEITAFANPCQTIAHYFEGRHIARISAKTHPEDARRYARVLAEGPVAVGDRVEVVR
jgi:MOSC domain-containing protein YiiM